MAIWDKWLKDKIRLDIDELMKADAGAMPDKPEEIISPEDQIGRKSIISDPYWDQVSQSTIFKHRSSRLSNKTLRDVSMRDWLISAIIQGRCDTLLNFSRPQRDKFKMGYRVTLRDASAQLTPEDIETISNLEEFLYNCGRLENTPIEDKMLLGEFFKKTTRDILTFGHIAVEKILTRNGGLHRFRPLPGESVYHVNTATSKEQIDTALRTMMDRFKYSGPNDPRRDQQINERPSEYYKWVQISLDQQVMAAFGDSDMIFKLFNPQNFLDSLGYCYSPLELSIVNVTNHLNTENYNANFFTHGYAARGILHLKGTVTQSQLHSFRRQFYNTINGAQHAWKTPIIAGLDDVQWVPMSGSNRDMEYINFNNHLLRSICTQFQIDPVELGLDFLTTGTGRVSGTQTTNQAKIEYSRERGLYPILMFFEDLINGDIIPTLDKALAEKYKFEFVGYTDETPHSQIALLQAQMSVHSSMNDLLKAAQKEPLNMPGADLPLNQAFWAMVERNYTKGEIREIFFGDKGATQRRELAYFPMDQAYQTWQQLMLTIDRQKVQDQMQSEQMDQQKQMMEKQGQQQEQQGQHEEQAHNREQEKHDIEMQQVHSQNAGAAVKAAMQEQPQMPAGLPTKK